jgi:TatD DNase family protein
LAIEEFEEHVVAVGECGIDLHYPESEKTLLTQQNVLASHCRLAQEYGLPLVIHSREAFAPTMDVLLDYTDMPIYMHCR